ncbi:hypothetical protein BH09ACT5_BH09ACT5_01440 [soil metagenome]
MVGGVLLLGGVGYIVVQLVGAAASQLAEGVFDDGGYYPEWEPLATGEPGSPVALDPLECPSQCLTYQQVDETAFTQDDLFALGLTVEDEGAGVGSAYAANSELSYVVKNWERGGTSPDACFPMSLTEPLAVALGEDLESPTDRIYYVSAYSDRDQWDYEFQSARVFESTEAASNHMASLSELVAGCTHYSAGNTDGMTWEADVTPAPALTVPDGVAAVGWQEASTNYRYYVFDLQRGNIVVRTTLFVTGSTPEKDFREAVANLALRLGGLQPTAG